MKQATILLCVAGAIGLTAQVAMGQDEWFEDFDSYTTDVKLPDQSTWEPWDGGGAAAADFWATTDQSISGPNSIEIDAADDAVHQFNYTEGVWGMTFWQFIPADAASGSTSLTLVNNYPAVENPDWSTFLTFDPVLNTVESGFEGALLPLKKGQWTKIYLIVNLDDDLQTIFYDDQILSQKSWKDGIGDGGQAVIAGIDLYGADSPFKTYYDDLAIEIVPTIGACCYLDGTCADAISESDCAFGDGVYQGHGTACDWPSVVCPELGECGWIITGPITWAGDTTDEVDSCDLSSGARDAQFELILPYDAVWTISVCDAGWDTILYLGSACCTDDIAESDDHPDCGASSKIEMALEAGTYYVTVEGYSSADYGPFPLVISSPCEVECDPDSIPEGEVDCYDFYVDEYNVGCNDDGTFGYPFTTIACGDIVCGTAGTYVGEAGGLRDTDWYEFDIASEMPVTLGGVGEFDFQLLLIDPGPGTCEEDSYTVLGSTGTLPCEFGEITRIMGPGETGKGWAWAGPSVFEGIECGSIYNMYVTCAAGPDCPEDITGPTGDPDGVVDVLDLLLVLSQWDSAGPEADITGPDGVPDGVVDVLDLLAVLAAWGDC